MPAVQNLERRDVLAHRLVVCSLLVFALMLTMVFAESTNCSAAAADKYRAPLDRCTRLLATKHVTEARAMLKQMAACKDAPAEVYNMYAGSFLDGQGIEPDSKECRVAIDGLQTALQREPDNGHTYCLLAFASNLKGDYKDAVLYSTKAISTRNPDWSALKQRAIAYSHLKNNRAALDDMLDLQKHGFKTTVNYMLTADIQRSLGLYKEAAENYSLGLQSGASFQQRIFNDMVKSLILSHQTDKAKAVINERLRKDSDNPELLDMRAGIEATEKDYFAALADLNRAIRTTDTGLYHTHLADVYSKMGKKDLAAREQELGKKKEAFTLFP